MAGVDRKMAGIRPDYSYISKKLNYEKNRPVCYPLSMLVNAV